LGSPKLPRLGTFNIAKTLYSGKRFGQKHHQYQLNEINYKEKCRDFLPI